MTIICVDSELNDLISLKDAVEKADSGLQTLTFSTGRDALRWARSNHVDAAFLNIALKDMDGLELARELLAINPQLSIVFVSENIKHAVSAINMHIDAGFLIKPVDPDQVMGEIRHIYAKKGSKRLKIKCFGDFDAFIDGKPIKFRRKMTRELLAYLVDRRGASVTAAQLCAVFWEDDAVDEKKKDSLYHLVSDLKKTLEENGCKDVFISQNYSYSINARAVDCDFYRMLEGDTLARNQYTGEYMNQYSWAEYTNSWIEREISKSENI